MKWQKMDKKNSDIRDKIVFGKIRDWKETLGGCERFGCISLNDLEKLLELGMIDPDDNQNGSPTIAEFMAFLKKYPNAFAHGYVISPDRDDARVSLEGLACEPGLVTSDMKDDFVELCAGADELTIKNGLYAWWD